MPWPAVGIVGGGEASVAAQPATGGRSMRHTLLRAAGARRPEVEEALGPLDDVGERSRNSKNFLRVTKIYLWRNQLRVEGEGIYIPL